MIHLFKLVEHLLSSTGPRKGKKVKAKKEELRQAKLPQKWLEIHGKFRVVSDTVDSWFRNPDKLTSWYGKYLIIYRVLI